MIPIAFRYQIFPPYSLVTMLFFFFLFRVQTICHNWECPELACMNLLFFLINFLLPSSHIRLLYIGASLAHFYSLNLQVFNISFSNSFETKVPLLLQVISHDHLKGFNYFHSHFYSRHPSCWSWSDGKLNFSNLSSSYYFQK